MPGVKRSKDQRFREDAEKRVLFVLREMRKLEELGDRKRYEYTEEQVAEMMGALTDGVERVKAAFTVVDEEPEFAFGGGLGR